MIGLSTMPTSKRRCDDIGTTASVSIYSLSTAQPLAVSSAKPLDQVTNAERRTFPRNEAMNFETELQKRSFELTLVVEEAQNEELPVLLAYVAVTRLKRKALLHKLCVLEVFQYRGIGGKILRRKLEQLKDQWCENPQLRVDEDRDPAETLYRRLEFEEVQTSKDYYAPGPNGVQMVLRLVRGAH